MAKDLARRSGMTLGEWLNQMIVDGGEPEAPAYEPAPRYAAPEPTTLDSFRRARSAFAAPEPERATRSLEALAARLEQAEHRSTLAISGIDQSVMGVLSRIEGVERDQFSVAARFEGGLDEVRDAHSRLTEKLRKIGDDEAPRMEALRSLEASLTKVSAQVGEIDSRARNLQNETRDDVVGVLRRLDRLEANPGADAATIARLTERLAEAESRTNAAVRALETSFAGLDARMARTETDAKGGADAVERRFGRLAAELSDKVEASRAEMAEKLRQASGGRLDQVEATLGAMTGHVQEAEQRSADAIDRMGREVMRIAQSMGTRVQAVEARSAQAVEQVGGEMARIADAMEARMRSADTLQAEALEKLGGEIGRIAEKLADRIAAAERRSAQAIDDVGDQVVRVTEKIQSRYDQAANELSERIRDSELRTNQVLEEARAKFADKLADAQRRSALEAAAPPPKTFQLDLSPAPAFVAPVAATPPPAPVAPPAVKADSAFAASPFPEEAFAVQDFAPRDFGQREAEPAPTSAAQVEPEDDDVFADADGFVSLPTQFDPPAAEFDPAPSMAADPFADPFDDEDDRAEALPPAESLLASPQPAQARAPEQDAWAPQGLLAEEAPAATDPASEPRGTNRDLIEAARAAARQASTGGRRGPAPIAEAAATPSRAFSFSLPRKKKKENGPTLRTALLASGTAATLSMAVAGYGLLTANHNETAPPPPVATAAADPVLSGSPAIAPVVAPMDTAVLAPAAPTDTLAVALAPAPASVAATAPAVAPAQAARPVPLAAPQPAAADTTRNLYAAAVRQIESGDPTGLEPLRRAANLGEPQAQFYLAKLYETGGAGLKKDIVEARRWTERAAQAGDSKAMHNLGLYFFEGAGGAKSTNEAAAWFRRAADLGLQDSQYNLARLYEEGFGVAKNTAEAYKWYLISGAGGDVESKSSAERVKKLLPVEAQTTAQRSATAFRAQIPGVMRAAAQ